MTYLKVKLFATYTILISQEDVNKIKQSESTKHFSEKKIVEDLAKHQLWSNKPYPDSVEIEENKKCLN